MTGVWDPTFDLSGSRLFELLLLPQQTDVQTQEGVTDTYGAVHRGHQQGEERQPLLPRRQREDYLTGDRHGNESQQVDGLKGMEQRALTTEGRE